MATIEQERALALAKARRRRSEAEAGPQAEADPGILDAIAFGAGQGLTFNTSDEIEAGIKSGLGLWGDYGKELEQTRANMEATRQKYPGAFIGSELAGGLTGGVGAMKSGLTLMRGAQPTAASLVGRGAAEGAGYGAAYGFGAGEGERDRFAGAAQGAAIGAAGGAAAGGLTASLVRRQAEKAIPSIEQLRTMADDAYRAADQAGVVVRPEGLQRLAANVQSDLAEFGYHPKLQPRIGAVLDEFQRISQQPATLKGVDQLRKIASAAGQSLDKSERKIAGNIVGKIDDYLTGLGVDDVVMGDSRAGATALQQARSLWRRMSKAQQVDDAISKAELRAASTGSGGNVENAARQNLRKILENPNRVKGFSDAERKALSRAVRGDPAQNVSRLVGKMSPTGGGLMQVMTGVGPVAGAVATGSPLPLAVPAIGIAGKKVAEALARGNISNVDKLVRAGGKIPKGSVSEARKAIAEALIRGQATGSSEVPLLPYLEDPNAVGRQYIR